MDIFDLIIVGSGSGNSIPDYMSDWKIALVERGIFGGTCLNVGCIPSKMFVLPATLASEARHGARLGINSRVDSVDWPAIRDRVFGLIDPIAEGGREYRATGSPNVEFISGTARFTGDRTFDVDGRIISAPKVLLAAGSRPWIPPIEGLDSVRSHTSDSIMRLDELPARLAVLGGGAIAVELGHVFSGYGSEVTLYNRSNILVRAEDPDISQRFTEVFANRVNLRLGGLPDRVEQVGDVIRIHRGDEMIEVDEVLVAVGREPNSDLLGTEAGGVLLKPNGRIKTDDTMATGAEGVWAIGDITNDFQLKHVANAEAKVAFWNIANADDQRKVDLRFVPHATFSHPQMAGVGMSEPDAVEAGKNFVVGMRDFGSTAYGWALDDKTSFFKVLIDSDTGLILGAHAIGPEAAILVQPMIQAMQFGETAERVANEVFYIHPALIEVVENALLDGLEKLVDS